MGDWNFLGGILEEVHIHSTMVGKIWLTILFIFRMLVLGVAAEDVWNDEQADFICNTEQPGCRNVCYDLAFPISLIRYWVLQVIFVSSPSLVYMGHALYRLRALEKERQRKKAGLRRELEEVEVEQGEARRRIEREMRLLDQAKLNKAPLRGSLLRTYVAHIVTRSAVEVGFITGQYVLYGFQLEPLFKCEREPCPNAVDCFVSRPTEKSVFMVFMQCIAFISLFLNVLEMLHLGYKALKAAILDFYPHLKDDQDDSYYSARCKKDSMVPPGGGGGLVGARKATLPSAPSGYNLLMEKAADGPAYPPGLISPASAFVVLQGEAGCKGGGMEPPHKDKEPPYSPTEFNSNSNNTCSSSEPPRSAPSSSVSPPKPDEVEERHPPLALLGELRGEEAEEGFDSPSLSRGGTTHSCLATLPVSAVRKPWRPTTTSTATSTSAPPHWQCSPVVEGTTSEADSHESPQDRAGGRGGRGRAHDVTCALSRLPSASKSRHSSRPGTPDSAHESSSTSRGSPRPLSPTCPRPSCPTRSRPQSPTNSCPTSPPCPSPSPSHRTSSPPYSNPSSPPHPSSSTSPPHRPSSPPYSNPSSPPHPSSSSPPPHLRHSSPPPHLRPSSPPHSRTASSPPHSRTASSSRRSSEASSSSSRRTAPTDLQI